LNALPSLLLFGLLQFDARPPNLDLRLKQIRSVARVKGRNDQDALTP
jgi:hypothetical protein